MNREDVKKLETWMTVPEAKVVLGVSRQALHKMIWEQDQFHLDEIRFIGDGPVYLLETAAVLKLAEARAAEVEEKENRKRFASRIEGVRTSILPNG